MGRKHTQNTVNAVKRVFLFSEPGCPVEAVHMFVHCKNILTDSETHQFINSEFRNYRLRLEWPLESGPF